MKDETAWDKPMVQRLRRILRQAEVALWGWADVAGLPRDELARYPRAVFFALAMDPRIMVTVSDGPNPTYADLYTAINERLDETAGRVVRALTEGGYAAWAVPASVRSDPVNFRGAFPHKTAATRAGLGSIGKNAQL